MRYIDSNVFIYPVVEPNSAKGMAARDILMKVAKGEIEVATSSLTWDEVVWVIKKAFSSELATLEGRRLLEFPNIKILSVDGSVLYVAQKLIENYKIAPRDAIHASCAITKNISEFISDDTDFDRIKRIKRVPF